jgi:hypothetical protein
VPDGIIRGDDPHDGFPKVMLLAPWRKHQPLHGEESLRRCTTLAAIVRLHAPSETCAETCVEIK